MKYLSYFLSEKTPLYGNGTGIEFKADKQIERGDKCNTMNLSFPNHSSTHIDFPFHFNSQGKTLNDYPAEFWQFEHIEIVDITGNVVDSQIIVPEMLPAVKNIEIELLLIKTGYGIFRGTNRYTLYSPGLSSELASYFRLKYPKLRCVGMDLISISSYSCRDEGHKAHHAFLNPDKGKEILIIEDMKLDDDGPFKKVIVAPLLIKNADGSPCTVFAYK